VSRDTVTIQRLLGEDRFSSHFIRFLITFDLQARVCFRHPFLITLLRLFCCVVLLKRDENCWALFCALMKAGVDRNVSVFFILVRERLLPVEPF